MKIGTWIENGEQVFSMEPPFEALCSFYFCWMECKVIKPGPQPNPAARIIL